MQNENTILPCVLYFFSGSNQHTKIFYCDPLIYDPLIYRFITDPRMLFLELVSYLIFSLRF